MHYHHSKYLLHKQPRFLRSIPFFWLVQPPCFFSRNHPKNPEHPFRILNSWKNPFRICWKKKIPTEPDSSTERPRSGAAGGAESALRPGGLCLGARLGDRSGDGDGHRLGGPADATGTGGRWEIFGQIRWESWSFFGEHGHNLGFFSYFLHIFS